MTASTTTPQSTKTAIGIDIGGTKISAASVRDGAMQSDYDTVATPQSFDEFIQAIVEQVGRHKATDADVCAVGIATAGIVNAKTGQIMGSTGNLPALQGHPNLKQALESKINLPVHVENDANAAAYGEAVGGAAKGAEDVLMATLGTGVGTGIVINGQLLRGHHFSAGESGHIQISMEKERRCTCTRWDCWEAYASGTGLKQTARHFLKNASSTERALILKDGRAIEQVRTHDVIEAWQDGNEMAQAMMDAWHIHIATGLGSLINVLDPEVVVLGGGMAQFVDFENLIDLTQQRSMVTTTRIVPATLGNQAGIVGAAQLALQLAN